MAAGAWTVYTESKKYLGNATLNLSTAKRITLHLSTSNAATGTLSIYSELTGEVTEQNGYSSSGKSLASVAWTVSGSNVKFDAADPVWTAAVGTISGIRFAVISNVSGGAAGKLVCYSQLSTGDIAVTAGNTLTLAFNSAGILVLS